jgi:1-acyl-sn-glycerol-3-phosphate acyltransferase
VVVDPRSKAPDAGPETPRRGNRVTRALARWLLYRARWRFAGTFPDIAKAVVIVAPHTSNRDFAVSVLAMFAVGYRFGEMFNGIRISFEFPF